MFVGEGGGRGTRRHAELGEDVAHVALDGALSFTVNVNETVTRNVILEVGGLTEVVQVRSQSELLQTSSAELGQ